MRGKNIDGQKAPILRRSGLCRSGSAGRTLSRSGVQPPTGTRRESSTPAKYLPRFQIRKSIPAINLSNCFLSSIPLSSRGWIVPVGGSTPDRLKAGNLHPCRISVCNSKSGKLECRSWNAGRPYAGRGVRVGEYRSSLSRSGSAGQGMSIVLEPVGECGSGSAGRTLSRSGVEPPTGTIHPRQISPATSNPERHIRQSII